MIVLVRLDVSDEERRAIRRRAGNPGLATRSEICSLVDMLFEQEAADALHDLQMERARREERRKVRAGTHRYVGGLLVRRMTKDEIAKAVAEGKFPAAPERGPRRRRQNKRTS